MIYELDHESGTFSYQPHRLIINFHSTQLRLRKTDENILSIKRDKAVNLSATFEN